MIEPEDKKVAAEVELDGDRSGYYLGAEAMHETNWQRDAAIILAARAASGLPFTADDLRQDGLGEPDKPARWGSLFLHAQREGVIVSVGVLNSRRTQRHGSLCRVWVGAHGVDVAA